MGIPVDRFGSTARKLLMRAQMPVGCTVYFCTERISYRLWSRRASELPDIGLSCRLGRQPACWQRLPYSLRRATVVSSDFGVNGAQLRLCNGSLAGGGGSSVRSDRFHSVLLTSLRQLSRTSCKLARSCAGCTRRGNGISIGHVVAHSTRIGVWDSTTSFQVIRREVSCLENSPPFRPQAQRAVEIGPR